jgi:hypothetical protein
MLWPFYRRKKNLQFSLGSRLGRGRGAGGNTRYDGPKALAVTFQTTNRGELYIYFSGNFSYTAWFRNEGSFCATEVKRNMKSTIPFSIYDLFKKCIFFGCFV